MTVVRSQKITQSISTDETEFVNTASSNKRKHEFELVHRLELGRTNKYNANIEDENPWSDFLFVWIYL